MLKSRSFRGFASGLSLILVTALGGCGVDDYVYPQLDLTIAHINDHHSNLDPIADQEFTVDGVKTRVQLGGMAQMAQAFTAYGGRDNVLKLHAGDAITGTSYFTFFRGEADAKMMNAICFDAFALGNHEFDESDAGLKFFLDALAQGGCGTAVLSSNVRPKIGTALAPVSTTDYFRPSTVRVIRGVKVGIVGVTIKQKTQQSSRPLSTTEFDDEVASVQRSIDQLKNQGIRHIVVLSHQGYSADKAMAARLTDVDAIIGGDSHSLLGDFSAIGLAGSEGAYPTIATNKDGELVCIGQAWEYNKAIGEMQLKFDTRGRVSTCTGQASLVVGSTGFKRANAQGTFVAVDEPTRESIANTLSRIPAVKVLQANPTAVSVLSAYAGQVASKKAEIVGKVSESLCLVRDPGESTNRSSGVAGCEGANLRARGSDISQVVAEAFLAGSLRADIAIQNGGGVRVALPAKDISFNDAITVLPFSNVLVELNLTGEQIKNVLEDALSNHLDNGGSTGSHPYAAGLRWDLDMSKQKGSRITALETRDRSNMQWAPIDAARTYVVVTNDFIASGQDGYSTFGTIFKAGQYVNTYLLYSQTFIDYIKAKGTLARVPRGDYAHKSVVTKSGTRLSD
ncbi:MAG: bifunctional metallophosphatase/5'-nucleotidase [Betaproteobacteria bacterium]|nr:bifunctional metallophosphatase/5'-nucleotidase [Betaproteobacteria bacterium]